MDWSDDGAVVDRSDDGAAVDRGDDGAFVLKNEFFNIKNKKML